MPSYATGGLGIDLAIGAALRRLTRSLTTCISVENMDVCVGELSGFAGVRVLQQPYDINGMERFAVFMDLERSRTGLRKLPEA